MWGFPYVQKNWNYATRETEPVELVVFSRADEVEVFVNGTSIGRKPVSMERPMPYSARFETTYQPGTVTAVSYRDKKEVSRDTLTTTGQPAQIRLVPETRKLSADGHDVLYMGIEILDSEGRIVPDAKVALTAEVSGAAVLAGFGSANPITEEDYTDNEATTFRGRAMLVLRSGYTAGTCSVTVQADGFAPATEVVSVE